MEKRKNVVVMFGGKSVEHDVSIISARQFIAAMDATKYNAIPVYISQDGCWYTGHQLLNLRNYPLSNYTKRSLDIVRLCISKCSDCKDHKPTLIIEKKVLFSRNKTIKFDVVVPVFHGTVGEDGSIQGLFETAGIPYAGPRLLSAAIGMDKVFCKHLFTALGIPTLPYQVIGRPAGEFYDIKKLTKDITIKFPVCVKPSNLGSSIGISRAKNQGELEEALMTIFALDTRAIVEPFVDNLVEYNIAVSKAFSEKIQTSAIERPFSESEILSFTEKYLRNDSKTGKSGKLDGEFGGGKFGGKISPANMGGMLSLSREFNPKLDKKQESNIREWATKVFEATSGMGIARIDFLSNKKTGEIWINEPNNIPGSFAFYLWEAAKPKVNFTQLTSALIEEGLNEAKKSKSVDPMIAKAVVFR